MTLFNDNTDINCRAAFIGQRINLKAFERATRLTESPFVIKAGQNGYAVLFRYGVVVMFGLSGVEETNFLQDIAEHVYMPFDHPDYEDGIAFAAPDKAESVHPEYIRIKEWNLDYIQLIAEVLAKSAVLTHYEHEIGATFDQIEVLATDMKKGGWPKGRHARKLLKHNGMTLSIQRKMVGQVEIAGKPELLWEKPNYESLYVRIEDEYEIEERHTALKDKLELVHQTAETMLSLLQERRTYHVEWYITLLIVLEVILGLYDKFGH